MSKRGRRPNPARLRLVIGTHRGDRHGPDGEQRQQADAALAAFGPLVMPKCFRGEAAYAWKRYIAPAWWLDASREAAAIAFCELWQEFRGAPDRFPAAKHAQLRAYRGDIGLGDGRPQPPPDADEHFDS